MARLWTLGRSAALALALALTLAAPAAAAEPAAGSFAEVLISAEQTDIPEESLQLALYRRDDAGAFLWVDTLDFTTPVNRVAKDVQLHLTPQSQTVSLQVDYLTDLDGDGVYELLDDQNDLVGETMARDGSLVPAQSEAAGYLASGVTYTLPGEDLLDGGAAEIAERTTSGSINYLAGLTPSNTEPDSILYMVTVSELLEGGTTAELCYYLRLYDELPAPSAADYLDVPADAWYYGAVDYAVSHGYLSGTARSQFSPDAPLTRAMLAQILYQVAGRPDSGISHYLDVPYTAWCYAAVSWAAEAGVMSGSSNLFDPDRAPARQELAVALYRFAQAQGLDVQNRADLSGYADAGEVSPWARVGVEWSVYEGLLAGHPAGDEMFLSPTEAVSRAEFAAVLRTLCETVLPPQSE